MDVQLVVATGVVLLASAFVTLVVLSPLPLATTDEERTYVSATSPLPTPLPNALAIQPSLKLSVIVPAYNESLRLPVMLDDALEHLRKTPERTFEVIVVDDESKDDTSAFALSYSEKYKDLAEIRVVRLRKNRGKGGGIKHGMLHARGERLLMVDADGASRFADLDKLWTELDGVVASDKEGRAVAVGSRAHLVGTEAVVKRSAIRNFLMYSFHTVLKTLGVGHIRDTQCGFKLFTRPAAIQLFSSLNISTWIFDVELLILALLLDIPVVEVPVHWHEVEGSKLRLLNDSVGMLKDLIVIRVNYALGRWKPKRQ
ncbi:hypothetical protein EXIGLDRAFT_723178 [Exidia glandulosa HHB12029]|uniref:dolichyl-phosphate beta-glucosyltransferase n=1 Tax=Exidia glandulosa HHB12029 TaxID=1314781 RepID=A0A165N0F5_EXIGL|nr:hypothetical protein EXIGLDRAFT_723178 [Exidia glandulosa HHB12029]